MARVLWAMATGAIVCFWITMNGLVVRRAIEYQGLDEYRRGFTDFLGNRLSRERWMGIYRERRRIGHTGFTVERRLGRDDMGYRVEFSTRIEIDLFGRGGELLLEGESELDLELLPEKLSAKLSVPLDAAGSTIRIEGKRDGDSFRIQVDSPLGPLSHRFALRPMHFGDGLAPLPPLAGLKPGDIVRIPVFDPILLERTESTTRVVAEEMKSIDGAKVDCLDLETHYRGIRITALATRDGEFLRCDLPAPLNVTLMHEATRPASRSPAPAARERKATRP